MRVGPGSGQEQLAGRGQVMGAAPGSTSETHSGTPRRGGQRLHVPGGLVRLAGVRLSISLPFLLVFLSAQRSEEMSVPSRYGSGKPCSTAFSRPRAAWAPSRRAPSRRPRPCTGTRWSGRSRNPGPAGGMCRPVPEPPQGEHRLLGPAVRAHVPVPGADLAAVICQQPGHEHHQWQRDVKDDTIGQHAEPPEPEGILVETSCTGGSAFPGSRCVSACLPV